MDNHVGILPKSEYDYINCESAFKIVKLTTLPDELLVKIFGFLTHKDLNMMSLVATRIRNVVRYPELWSTYLIPCIGITKKFGLEVLSTVLKLPQFKKLEVLDLNGVLSSVRKKKGIAPFETDAQSSKQFMEVLSIAMNFPLRCLDLSNNNLGRVQKKIHM